MALVTMASVFSCGIYTRKEKDYTRYIKSVKGGMQYINIIHKWQHNLQGKINLKHDAPISSPATASVACRVETKDNHFNMFYNNKKEIMPVITTGHYFLSPSFLNTWMSSWSHSPNNGVCINVYWQPQQLPCMRKEFWVNMFFFFSILSTRKHLSLCKRCGS